MAGMTNAHSLLEMIFALWICLCIVFVLPMIYRPLLHFNEVTSQLDIVFALYQLSDDIHLAERIEVQPDELILYDIDDKPSIVSLHQGRIVKQPGFNIYLHDVDEMYFEKVNDFLYIYIERGNNGERYEICSIKRYTKEEWLCDDGRTVCDCESDDTVVDAESNINK